MVSCALLPFEMVCSKLTLVVCESSSWETVGESEMVWSPEVTLVEWILSSVVLREIEVVSSLTSKLESRQHFGFLHVCSDILNNHLALICEVFKVRLQGQVIVHGLDICRQHFTRSRNCGRSMLFTSKVPAHVSSM
jgi:hypothetical protein